MGNNNLLQAEGEMHLCFLYENLALRIQVWERLTCRAPALQSGRLDSARKKARCRVVCEMLIHPPIPLQTSEMGANTRHAAQKVACAGW